jgi:hypothetical protein
MESEEACLAFLLALVGPPLGAAVHKAILRHREADHGFTEGWDVQPGEPRFDRFISMYPKHRVSEKTICEARPIFAVINWDQLPHPSYETYEQQFFTRLRMWVDSQNWNEIKDGEKGGWVPNPAKFLTSDTWLSKPPKGKADPLRNHSPQAKDIESKLPRVMNADSLKARASSYRKLAELGATSPQQRNAYLQAARQIEEQLRGAS